MKNDSNVVKITIVGLPGSIREGSYTRLAVELALQGAAENGAETELLDLRDYDLVFCDGKKDDEHSPAEVVKLRRKLRAAQGIIIGTPEYHGSYSGVLKNALDLMGFQEFEGKIIGLIGVSGGAMGGLSAMISLRNIGRVLHAWVIPEQAAIPRAYEAFSGGELGDERLKGRVLEVGRQVARFACLHNAAEAWEFVKCLQEAPDNPGGK